MSRVSSALFISCEGGTDRIAAHARRCILLGCVLFCGIGRNGLQRNEDFRRNHERDDEYQTGGFAERDWSADGWGAFARRTDKGNGAGRGEGGGERCAS